MHFLYTEIHTLFSYGTAGKNLSKHQDISSLKFMLLILMACIFYKAVLPLGELQKLDARNLEVEGLKTQR